jgi:hypothetical protein
MKTKQAAKTGETKLKRTTKQVCEECGVELQCPACKAARGGQTTARKHATKLSAWGKMGGRPRKKVRPK